MHYYRRNSDNTMKAGLLGLAVGAVLGLLFAPKSGKETRDDMRVWTEDMSAEIYNRMKDMRDITMDKYNDMVDQVARKYRNSRRIKDSELNDFVDEMKMRWDRIKDQWQE